MWSLTMEAPYMFLVFLLCAGFVSGQRSRSRILGERLYLETLANKTDVTNVTALNALMTKPLETTTTTTPTPVTEGMDYEGNGQPFGQPLSSRRHVEPRSALLQRRRYAPLR